MGLRGPGAIRRLNVADKVKKGRKRKFPWRRSGLSRVARVVAFLQFLPITKGILEGKRMKLLPEQRDFIERVYGPTKKGGRRLVKIGIQSEPKGNGKTGLVAGLCLCHLLGPESEPRGEIYSASTNRVQAGITFEEMEAIIFAVPEFAARCNVQRFVKKIEDLETGSKYEALSSDARGAQGKSPTLWVYDELAQEQDRELLDNLMQGMSKRKEALGLIISTQAPSDEHPLSQLIDDGLTGEDPTTVVQLICAPEGADVFDLEVLRACNPAWGKFLDVDDVIAARDRAKRMEATEPSFRNLRANQRVDSRAENKLVSNKVWNMGADTVDRAKLKGKRCFGGLDLSGKHDLSALVLVFDLEDGTFEVLPFFWTPQGQLQNRKPAEKKLFDLWIKRGLIKVVPGNVIRYGFIAKELAALSGEFKIDAIGYDRWRIDEFKADLDEQGIGEDDLRLEPFGQGFKDMGPAVEFFAECALNGEIRHGAHPVLTSAIGNCLMLSDPAGNVKFDKNRSNRAASVRIDGAVALVMALGTYKRHFALPKKPSLDAMLQKPVMVI